MRTGDRVRIVAAPGFNAHFVGESGTVWCADRTGAVVTLDSSGVADTRFVNAQLAPVARCEPCTTSATSVSPGQARSSREPATTS
jgi:hypothetical protein